jgi:hypothetical protein
MNPSEPTAFAKGSASSPIFAPISITTVPGVENLTRKLAR